MAQKVTVTLEDDIDGSPADETIRFRLGSAAYEIDLSSAHARGFRQQLAPFIQHARKATPPPRPGRTAASRRRSSDIRTWAKDQGIAVSGRGRIPASVAERYQAAQDTARGGLHFRSGRFVTGAPGAASRRLARSSCAVARADITEREGTPSRGCAYRRFWCRFETGLRGS